jgi:tRNA(Glu) U13 pseudouridine synthase TruD
MSNTTNESKPITVEKESISDLKFPDEEVLTTNEAIKNRTDNLDRALKLGNLEHNKIKIVFEDSGSLKQVETTVWGITDKRVILKQGVVIPINRIHEVKV